LQQNVAVLVTRPYQVDVCLRRQHALIIFGECGGLLLPVLPNFKQPQLFVMEMLTAVSQHSPCQQQQLRLSPEAYRPEALRLLLLLLPLLLACCCFQLMGPAADATNENTSRQ
jgi:hypothetical protein